MNKIIRQIGGVSVPSTGQAIVTRADGTTYELPSYAEYRKSVREQYKGEADLDRQAARFAFDWQRDEITYLRSVGMDDLADMYAANFDGMFMPTARWLRDRVTILRKPHDQKYRENHREQRRQSMRNGAKTIDPNSTHFACHVPSFVSIAKEWISRAMMKS